jgi:hypothetical protein
LWEPWHLPVLDTDIEDKLFLIYYKDERKCRHRRSLRFPRLSVAACKHWSGFLVRGSTKHVCSSPGTGITSTFYNTRRYSTRVREIWYLDGRMSDSWQVVELTPGQVDRRMHASCTNGSCLQASRHDMHCVINTN